MKHVLVRDKGYISDYNTTSNKAVMKVEDTDSINHIL